MPELFIRCPICHGSRVVPSEKYGGPADCHTCLTEGFIRYGQEQGHEHQWITRVEMHELWTPEWWEPVEFDGGPYTDEHLQVRPAYVFCACGKTPAEVKA